MKVKELIELLSYYKEDLDVIFMSSTQTGSINSVIGKKRDDKQVIILKN